MKLKVEKRQKDGDQRLKFSKRERHKFMQKTVERNRDITKIYFDDFKRSISRTYQII